MSDALLFDDGLNTRWRAAVEDHKAHAAREWPREAVGLITQDGAYHPCQNVAADPHNDFEVRDAQLLGICGGRPAAVLHSHTSLPHPVTGATQPPLDSPSAADMTAQMAMGVPWGISLCIESGASDPFWFGDQVPRPPLLGRVFRHGVLDCYAYIRDWHARVPGIAIPDFPRGDAWWEPGDREPLDLYAQGFAEAGFRHVGRPYEPLPGDVFLCRVKAPVLNHGGVYLGDGLLGHHLLFQLSTTAPASLWRPKLDFLVRHRDLPEDWTPPP